MTLEFWRDLAQLFRALPSAATLRANWSAEGWGLDDCRNWCVGSGSSSDISLFQSYATRGAVALGQDGLAPDWERWLDCLKEDGTDFQLNEGGASSGGMGTVYHTFDVGRIRSVCEASARFCEKRETDALVRQAQPATRAESFGTHRPSNVFRTLAGGKQWELIFNGKRATLKSTIGLEILHSLLDNPGHDFSDQEILARELVTRDGGIERPHRDYVPVVDDDYLKGVKVKMRELQHELGVAEQNRDLATISLVKPQIEEIESFVLANTFKGKPKQREPEADRARSLAWNHYNAALGTIRGVLPELEDYLRSHVRRADHKWSYSEDPGAEWRLR
jgi:hypothetical protein